MRIKAMTLEYSIPMEASKGILESGTKDAFTDGVFRTPLMEVNT
jgi:hypothetical protein